MSSGSDHRLFSGRPRAGGEQKQVLKRWCVEGTFLLVQCLVCIPTLAQVMPPPHPSDEAKFDFVPHTQDGLSIRRPGICGHSTATKDSLFRDLGKGISLAVLPSYHQSKGMSVNLIFIYFEKKESLGLTPERFELHLSPSGKKVAPVKVLRRSAQIERYDQFQEEVYLEFPVSVRESDAIAFVFPPDTIRTTSGDSSPLRVRPFTFNLVRGSASAAVARDKTICMYSPIDRDAVVRDR